MVRCWARCVAVADRGGGRNNDGLAFRTLRRQRGLRGACRAIGEVVVASQVPRLRGRARADVWEENARRDRPTILVYTPRYRWREEFITRHEQSTVEEATRAGASECHVLLRIWRGCPGTW